eukprot:771414-Prorocentrum_minimum.AAC.5
MKNHDMLEEQVFNAEEAGFFTSRYCQTLQLIVSSGAQITERDEAPLKYLVDIISDKELGDSEQKGFRLHFHFLPNPYFENTSPSFVSPAHGDAAATTACLAPTRGAHNLGTSLACVPKLRSYLYSSHLAPIAEGEREYTRSRHQSQKGRENIPATGTNRRMRENIQPSEQLGLTRALSPCQA